MAVENDRTALVPHPPPPRPARRDAAIDAALRKFEGAGQPAIGQDRSSRSWSSSHRPQLAMLATAALLVVIGIPATLIGLRNPVPVSEPAGRSAAIEDRSAPASSLSKPSPPVAKPATPAMPAPPPAARRYEGADGAVVAENKPAAGVAAPAPVQAPADAVQLAEAAAPPAPPATAAMPGVASNEVPAQAQPQNIVVTGSRIPAPARSAAKSRAERDERAFAAPDQSYAAFLSQLQSAVRSNNPRAIIALIGLPLRVNYRGGSRIYPDARSVEADFSRVFTPKVRRAILNQRSDKLFVRDQGAMIGDGEVWFDHTCPNPACSPPAPVRIRSINP